MGDLVVSISFGYRTLASNLLTLDSLDLRDSRNASNCDISLYFNIIYLKSEWFSLPTWDMLNSLCFGQ